MACREPRTWHSAWKPVTLTDVLRSVEESGSGGKGQRATHACKVRVFIFRGFCFFVFGVFFLLFDNRKRQKQTGVMATSL